MKLIQKIEQVRKRGLPPHSGSGGKPPFLTVLCPMSHCRDCSSEFLKEEGKPNNIYTNREYGGYNFFVLSLQR